MKYGVINSKDLFGPENPHGVMSAAYGLAMLALKSDVPMEQRVEAMDRLLTRNNLNPKEIYAQPDRAAALQRLAAKAKMTLTPAVAAGFNQVLDALVNRRKGELQGEIDARQQDIGSLDKRLSAESVVEALLNDEDRAKAHAEAGKALEAGDQSALLAFRKTMPRTTQAQAKAQRERIKAEVEGRGHE